MKVLLSLMHILTLSGHHVSAREDGKIQLEKLPSSRGRRWVFGGPPQFHPDSPGNVTAQLGGSAYLPCRIKNLGNKSVSWVRRRDSHILTVDRYTFIADERFIAWHDRSTRSWTLMVKYVQDRDAGVYECQVSTEPKMSLFVQLTVIKPRVEIGNVQDLHVKQGSRVVINCTIKNSIEVPQYIFWYHDSERIVSEHSTRQMQVRKIPPQTTVGSYSIESATLTDSGNYTCEPAGLENATVTLHVLAGEEPAAMQHGTNSGVQTDLSNIVLGFTIITGQFSGGCGPSLVKSLASSLFFMGTGFMIHLFHNFSLKFMDQNIAL